MNSTNNIKKQEITGKTDQFQNMLRTSSVKDYHIVDVQKNFGKFISKGKKIVIRGRVRDIRDIGKVVFATVEDCTDIIQLLYEEKNDTPNKLRGISKGDIVEVYGLPILSKNKTNSIKVEEIMITVKPIKIAPRKLINSEKKRKKRYLDLMVNGQTREIFFKVAKTLRNTRYFLYDEEFIEFETSILKPDYDGGESKPFITHHNSIGTDFYLRVTSELQLKELLVGGYEKVFEIGKSFRNEGIGKFYHPEFTILEAYSINTNYNYMMDFVERMVRRNVLNLFGSMDFEYNNHKIDVSQPWKRIMVKDAIRDNIGLDIEDLAKASAKEIIKISNKLGLNNTINYEMFIKKIIEHKIRPMFTEPTFLINLPSSLSPFAKEVNENSFYSKRAWGYVGGLDLCDIFTDQNDPKIVKQKFQEEDMKLVEKIKYSHTHSDYIDALEYGLIPSSGIGFSMTRFYMLMTDSKNIRDVILFPHT